MRNKSKLKTIISVTIVLIAVFAITKNLVAKVMISNGVQAITGLKVNMKSINIGIFRTSIHIKDLEIFNPSGFKDSFMLHAPEVYADYNLGDFLRKKAHFEEIRLELKELIVVKNAEGELNLKSLNVVKKKKEDNAPEKKKSSFEIDVLELKIGKVIYKDYSQGVQPKVREYDVNIDGRFKNIKDPRTFVRLILFKALVNTEISSITNFDLLSLGEDLGDVLGATSKAAGTVTGKAIGAVGDVAESVTKKATGAIKKILPFGK